ncbi:hypothetical protein OsJ_06220 [Oryza sativa Japonica Group]|uniref:Uncharacterized protein n=1 Tax=Oryza sativa subsp. japonica TaxID=39947 RepID=B9F4Y7_ORYSJ|nr:hypothetical protein OsJ_06220 [Oryza sativa Japonica Group]
MEQRDVGGQGIRASAAWPRPPPLSGLTMRVSVSSVAGLRALAVDAYNQAEDCTARWPQMLTQSVRCNATQTQSAQRKSSTATVKRSDPKGKTQGPKLDDGSGGFPPFRFGKGGGGGGGGGGGSNYFGGFLLFTCVLLLDYLKEFEKNLIARRQRAGYDANNDMFQQ